jgi:DNA-binding transcriptional ArsR family regulator
METNHAIDALAALAQETRLTLFRLLVRTGPDGLCAGDIAQALGVPAPTLSFHLNQLCQAGLLDQRREGRSLIYTVRFEGIRELLAFLMEDCCQGRPEACGPNNPLCETKESSCCQND